MKKGSETENKTKQETRHALSMTMNGKPHLVQLPNCIKP